MLLNALEIKKQRFRHRLLGFDQREVRSFLDAVAEDFVKLRHRLDRLEVELREREQELDRFRQIERSMRDAMMMASESVELARERAEGMVVDARERARAIVSEGEASRRAILAEAESHRRELRLDLESLDQKRELALSRLRSLLKDQQAILESHTRVDAQDEPETGEANAKVLSMRDAK